MDRAFAYVSCSEEDSRVKVQKYCRKIYELGYIPICPRFGFVPFLDESNAEDQQGLAQMSVRLVVVQTLMWDKSCIRTKVDG